MYKRQVLNSGALKPERPSVQTLEEGEGRQASARRGEGYKFASATFFRRELNSFGQPAFCLAGNRVATVPPKKKGFLLMKLFKAVF